MTSRGRTRVLLLRHEIAVLQRQVGARPKMNWADRALIALLLEAIPKRRRAGLRLDRDPATVLRWRRGIVRRGCAAPVSLICLAVTAGIANGGMRVYA